MQIFENCYNDSICNQRAQKLRPFPVACYSSSQINVISGAKHPNTYIAVLELRLLQDAIAPTAPKQGAFQFCFSNEIVSYFLDESDRAMPRHAFITISGISKNIEARAAGQISKQKFALFAPD